jgi:hypothetical protein
VTDEVEENIRKTPHPPQAVPLPLKGKASERAMLAHTKKMFCNHKNKNNENK